MKPDNYDFELLKGIRLADDAGVSDASIEEFGVVHGDVHGNVEVAGLERDEHAKDGMVLLRARKWALVLSVLMTIAYLILWPIPMYASDYGTYYLASNSTKKSSWHCINMATVFSRGFFKAWVVVLFLWAFYAGATITLLPIWEGRKSMKLFAVYIMKGRSGLKESTLPEVTESEEVQRDGVAAGSGESLTEKTVSDAEMKTT